MAVKRKIDKKKILIQLLSLVLAVILVGGTLVSLLGAA